MGLAQSVAAAAEGEKKPMTFKRKLGLITVAMGMIGGTFLFMGIYPTIARPWADVLAIAFAGLLALSLYRFGLHVRARGRLF